MKKCDITIPTTDLAKQWQGWGTALKPSFEPIIVARKPFKGSLVDNVIEYGVGGINIDECRVETQDNLYRKPCENGSIYSQQEKHYTTGTMNDSYKLGRFPANTILTYDEIDYDEVCGGFPNTKSNGGKQTTRNFTDYNGGNCNSYMNISNRKIDTGRIDTGYIAPCDSGSASRYFYCAKASAKDRNEGLEKFEEKKVNDGRITPIDNAFQRGETLRRNSHPCVKPCELMQYLIRLVTPNNGTILDPFNGSGSTGKAVMYENKERNKNYKYIGIELTEEYLPISKARIEYVYEEKTEVDNQTTIFDFIK